MPQKLIGLLYSDKSIIIEEALGSIAAIAEHGE